MGLIQLTQERPPATREALADWVTRWAGKLEAVALELQGGALGALWLASHREDSPTRGVLMERFLGPDDYSLVVIPPWVWTGFKGMSDISMLANCATHPHDPSITTQLLYRRVL